MNTFLGWVNDAGDVLVRFGGSMAWQSAVLVLVLLIADVVLRNRVRAALRYGLWLLMLIKLALPPGIGLPTSAAYWWPAAIPTRPMASSTMVVQVTDGNLRDWDAGVTEGVASSVKPRPLAFRYSGALFIAWLAGVAALGVLLIRRAWGVARMLRSARPAPDVLNRLLGDCQMMLGWRRPVPVRLSSEISSPAVCGLLRPVILLPSRLAEEWPAARLKPVVLHELAHIVRGDLWVNHVQCLLQILYWWHPLVWIGNAAIRRTRELAVDEQVMIALGREADDYPVALLEIARSALTRPGLGLGLVGILERARALRSRLRRLIERPLPPAATLGWPRALVIGLVGLVVLPMTPAPRSRFELRAAEPVGFNTGPGAPGSPTADPTVAANGKAPSNLLTRWFKVAPDSLIKAVNAGRNLKDAPGDLALDPEGMLAGIREIIGKAGIELNAPKALVYKGTLAMLMVRATPEDLEGIERILQAILTPHSQVTIEAKFVEIAEGGDVNAVISAMVGFDISTRKGAVVTTSGQPAALTARTNAAPSFTSVLTATQYRSILGAVERQAGADVLAVPRVTTLSGRQAQIKTVAVRTVVTDLDRPERPGDSPLPITQTFEFGPMLDVVPVVQRDERSIQMTLIPTLREFVGYDDESARKVGKAAGVAQTIPLPIFRLRQAVTSAMVRDGQTIALGLGSAEAVEKTGGAVVRKHLVVFVTPTLIDPAGNRLHSEE